MPVVLRAHGYKFWFYEVDLGEPPHIHVGKDGNQAKFWLNPVKSRVLDWRKWHLVFLTDVGAWKR
jgi:hypothetical protein